MMSAATSCSFWLRVLRCLIQEFEGLFPGTAVFSHDDSGRQINHRPALHGRFQVRSEQIGLRQQQTYG
jgi:hypothetical protein